MPGPATVPVYRVRRRWPTAQAFVLRWVLTGGISMNGFLRFSGVFSQYGAVLRCLERKGRRGGGIVWHTVGS
jgi:hypothetical protein